MTLTVPVERLSVPKKLLSDVRARVCACVSRGTGEGGDSLVNKSCQMSLSWRCRSSSGSGANSEDLGDGTAP